MLDILLVVRQNARQCYINRNITCDVPQDGLIGTIRAETIVENPTKVPFDPCNCRSNQFLHGEFQALRCAWLDWWHLAHLRCRDASGEGGDVSNSDVNHVVTDGDGMI